ncbi:hypothetical protein CLM82_02005, partial [Streptomyces albidoflavus]|uniref:hypothetical protein n=1 Tax=Streptomyces albidoflavus TaxID=1886 RepID=UPI000BDC4A70
MVHSERTTCVTAISALPPPLLGAAPAGAPLALARVAGVVARGAGKIWGAPDDLISRALKGLIGVDALGEVTYAAVSILLVLVVYF